MSMIATAVRHLMAAGVTGEALIAAIADMEDQQPKDMAAERRREWDRERKRKAKLANASTGIPPESVESAEQVEDAPLSRPPNENISNPPTHTPPDITTRARDPFPKPDWADPQVWRDLKANRKAKRLPCTPTAHAKLLRDIGKLTNEEWPPGRLLEAIVARGWAAAYDPRESLKNERSRQSPANDEPRNPYVRAVLARQAERAAGIGGEPDCWP